jgi:hypothetical protein
MSDYFEEGKGNDRYKGFGCAFVESHFGMRAVRELFLNDSQEKSSTREEARGNVISLVT